MTDTVARARLDEPLVPNAETMKAMKAARRGELEAVVSPADLLESLHAGEQDFAGAQNEPDAK